MTFSFRMKGTILSYKSMGLYRFKYFIAFILILYFLFTRRKSKNSRFLSGGGFNESDITVQVPYKDFTSEVKFIKKKLYFLYIIRRIKPLLASNVVLLY